LLFFSLFKCVIPLGSENSLAIFLINITKYSYIVFNECVIKPSKNIVFLFVCNMEITDVVRFSPQSSYQAHFNFLPPLPPKVLWRNAGHNISLTVFVFVLLERSALCNAGECIEDTSLRSIMMTNLTFLVSELVRLVYTYFYRLFQAEVVYLFRNTVK